MLQWGQTISTAHPSGASRTSKNQYNMTSLISLALCNLPKFSLRARRRLIQLLTLTETETKYWLTRSKTETKITHETETK